MSNVIVAGAGGFLGKALVDALIEKGYSIVSLETHQDDELMRKTKCICVSGMSDVEIAANLSEEYDCFFDLAWVGTSGNMRADYNVQLKNIKLTCDYVKIVASIKCKRFIYFSSINEIETYEYFQSENICPVGGYIYGCGKLAARIMAETVAGMNGIEFIPVIITNIYGKGERSKRLIYTSIKKLLQGEHCSFTAGYQNYDFIYISDAINSIIAIAEKGIAFNSYYIGSGNPRPLREYLLTIGKIVAPNAKLGFGDIPFCGANVDYGQFDLKKVERDTGYVNTVSFEEGIRITAEYIKNEDID